MITSDDLYLVAALSREKSLASVARSLNITPSAISQRLAAMESRLQIRVAERVGRSGIILTSEGEMLAEKGRKIIEDLSQLNDTLATRRGVVAGKIHIVAPFGFSRLHLAPLIGDFQQLYPDISLNLTLSDQLGRLPKEGWDVIIHIGPLRDSTLKMYKLAANSRILCASPDYIARNGVPKHPNELTSHHCIAIYEDGEDVTLWRFKNKAGKNADIRVTARLSSNDGETSLLWALSGKGIILRSQWSVAEHIARGELIPLLPGWTLPDAPIVALTSGPKGRTQRVQTLLDYLQEKLSAPAWLSS